MSQYHKVCLNIEKALKRNLENSNRNLKTMNNLLEYNQNLSTQNLELKNGV